MPHTSQQLSVAVIAGGLSRRLGSDKRRLRLWGEAGPTLLEQTLARVATLGDDLLVVLNDPEQWPDLPARTVPDAYGDTGALGGLATALAAARHDYVLVVAADMPLLNLELLRAMAETPRPYDALVARLPLEEGDKRRNKLNIEPLHAIYHRRCLPSIERQLAAGKLQSVGFFVEVAVRYLDNALLERLDPGRHSFLSVNTPEQLAAAQQLIRK